MNFQKIPYKKYKVLKNCFLLQSCIVGLGVRVWTDMQEVPGSNPTLGQNLILLLKLYFFSIFFKNENLPKKMYIFQTHFGFTNLGSKVFRSHRRAISFGEILSWTPCMFACGNCKAKNSEQIKVKMMDYCDIFLP